MYFVLIKLYLLLVIIYTKIMFLFIIKQFVKKMYLWVLFQVLILLLILM